MAGTVSAKPGGIPESIQSLFPNTLKSRRSLHEAPTTVLTAAAAVIGQAVFTMVSAEFVAMAVGVVGLYMVIEASGIWVIGLIGPIALAALLMLPDTRTGVATETNRS